MTDPALRPVASTDGELLRVATLGNMNWAEERFSVRDVLARPEFAHYTRLDVERGDFGFAAEDGGRAIGVVWALYLPADDAGYGFLDPQTPEVSLWVDVAARGHGLGRYLLRRLTVEAHRRGIARLSLSVEAGNYAKRLYESEGFRDVPGRERDGVMIWVCGDDSGPTPTV